ncbi:hypothetical protein ACTNES_11830 [Blautia sp. HCP3S3_D9]|uniref:hypothetical protein n=1 Tax=unclassified Blautia TaxID=2648079 RepID=UPI0025BB9643|nr:hypothetical protein [Blautia sp.]MCI7450638.1 hypothetical protein [Blautia sp.]MDD6414095.1 hypothetical protein [Blautia sp.]MDY4116180.1 hypothetical protein [Blautia sp.]
MDVASMIAINNRNMITMMNALQEVNHIVLIKDNGKEYEDMSGSMLDQYIGKECVVSLFNEVGAIKGKLMDADSQWVKVETPKKGTQLINRNMIRNITFSL